MITRTGATISTTPHPPQSRDALNTSRAVFSIAAVTLVAFVLLVALIAYIGGVGTVAGAVVASGAACAIGAVLATEFMLMRPLRNADTEGARMQAIMTAMRDGVCCFDAAGRLNYMNAAAERMLDRRLEDYVGEAWATDFPLSHRGNDSSIPTVNTDSTLISRVLARTAYAGRDAVTCNGGSILAVEVRMEPLVLPGLRAGAVLLFSDDTERTREEQAKDDFVGFASHELRSPLTAMHGFSSWLATKLEREPWRFDANTAEAIAALASETGRMESIIELFLDLTQIRMDRLSLEPSLVDVLKLLREEAAAVRSRYPEAVLDETLPATRLLGIMDEQRLRQIVLNLLDNAAKYGGANPRIVLSLVDSDGIAEIRVKDFGAGIPREDQQHIFERFFRSPAPATGSKKGFGIGLYVTKQLVDRMGGQLSFTSVEGEGTEFTLLLPLIMEEVRTVVEEAQAEERAFAGVASG